jgi:predicted nucleic acid-binding protein
LKGIIVSNATPSISFSRINELDLFRQIVGEITIPQEVAKELYEHKRADVPVLNRSRWIKTRKVKHATVAPALSDQLLNDFDRSLTSIGKFLCKSSFAVFHKFL